PDGKGIDGAGHLVDGRGFIFLFNPSDHEQGVEWRKILWEPEIELSGDSVALSDWTDLAGYKSLAKQPLEHPTGKLWIGPRGVMVLGVNLKDEEVLAKIRAERAKIGI
ncbi:MAG TPA: hypothetical protein VFI02_19420, partial [Armatimonadota bacterium]|nr:hypothetical protein [Armatimonadota bacterium]